MSSDLGFLAPSILLTLPLLMLFALFLSWRERERSRRITILGLTPGHSSNSRRIILLLLVPVLSILALARPYFGSSSVEVSVQEDDYMFVVDVSQSMLTKDLLPSRIAVARRKMKDLIAEFSRKGGASRFGITLFAGSSYLFCPLTTDFGVLRQFIDKISPEMVTSLGSNLEAGIKTALERFEKSRSQGGRLLILSDGEDDKLAVSRIVALLQGKNTAADVLGIGTPEGRPIERVDGTFLKDSRGSAVISRLQEDGLQQIASGSGGVYVRSSLGDEDVQALVYTDLLRVKGGQRSRERQIRTYGEIGPFLALAAAVLLFLGAVTRTSNLALRVVILFVLSSTASLDRATAQSEEPSAFTQSEEWSAREAFNLYQSGEFKEAAKAFQDALVQSPSDRAIMQGLASALFKSGKVAEGQEIFKKLAETAEGGREFFENRYNEGNALMALSRYKEAVAAYDSALAAKPDDDRAQHNRLVAQKRLEEEERRAREATPTPTPNAAPTAATANPTPSPRPSPNPDASPSPGTTPNNTPDASPSPGETPYGTPSPNPSGTPQGSPSPSGSASPHPEGSENKGVETPKPTEAPAATTPEPLGTVANDEDRLKESIEPPPTPAANGKAISKPMDESNPAKDEANAWLQSLPESPLLPRRHFDSDERRGQTW
jgi:Ca-activated chloride channel family protein